MAETARTQRHIYVGSSLDDIRDQPGFDRAGFHPDSKAVREGSAFGKPSGAESYFIVVTNREHHLTHDGRVFPGSTDLPLVHELLWIFEFGRWPQGAPISSTRVPQGAFQARCRPNPAWSHEASWFETRRKSRGFSPMRL
jgi:hypothetical protein